jgi:hypothetical protein
MKQWLLCIMLSVLVYFYFFSTESMQSSPKNTSATNYVTSMRDGIIKGTISTLITGGISYEKLIDGAVSYGILNPILKFIS